MEKKPEAADKPEKLPKLIHVAFLKDCSRDSRYLFLRQINPHRYEWLEVHEDGQEIPTDVWGPNPEEAMRLANRQWKNEGFNTLRCGFRYTLPERDEHGTNALFCQLAASLSSMNGVYFDEELGHNCFVQGNSIEARDLMLKLKKENKL